MRQLYQTLAISMIATLLFLGGCKKEEESDSPFTPPEIPENFGFTKKQDTLSLRGKKVRWRLYHADSCHTDTEAICDSMRTHGAHQTGGSWGATWLDNDSHAPTSNLCVTEATNDFMVWTPEDSMITTGTKVVIFWEFKKLISAPAWGGALTGIRNGNPAVLVPLWTAPEFRLSHWLLGECEE